MKKTIKNLVDEYGRTCATLNAGGEETRKEYLLFSHVCYQLRMVLDAARDNRPYARRLVRETVEELKKWDCAEEVKRSLKMYKGRGVDDTPWYQEWETTLKKLEKVNAVARHVAEVIEQANKTRFY